MRPPAPAPQGPRSVRAPAVRPGWRRRAAGNRSSRRASAAPAAAGPRRACGRNGAWWSGMHAAGPTRVKAMASPSSTSCAAGSARAASAISGIAAVTSLRLRVKMRTSSPRLCTWMRAPSIFHSKATSPESVSSASSTSPATCASIGAMGDITCSWKRCRPGCAGFAPDARECAEIAFVHGGTTDFGSRHLRHGRDRVDHDARERALAQLAHQQSQQELLLRAGWRGRTAFAVPSRVARPNRCRGWPPIRRAFDRPREARGSVRPRRPSRSRAAPMARCRCAPGGFRLTGTARRFRAHRHSCRAGSRRAGAFSRSAPTWRQLARRWRPGWRAKSCAGKACRWRGAIAVGLEPDLWGERSVGSPGVVRTLCQFALQ